MGLTREEIAQKAGPIWERFKVLTRLKTAEEDIEANTAAIAGAGGSTKSGVYTLNAGVSADVVVDITSAGLADANFTPNFSFGFLNAAGGAPPAVIGSWIVTARTATSFTLNFIDMSAGAPGSPLVIGDATVYWAVTPYTP